MADFDSGPALHSDCVGASEAQALTTQSLKAAMMALGRLRVLQWPVMGPDPSLLGGPSLKPDGSAPGRGPRAPEPGISFG